MEIIIFIIIIVVITNKKKANEAAQQAARRNMQNPIGQNPVRQQASSVGQRNIDSQQRPTQMSARQQVSSAGKQLTAAGQQLTATLNQMVERQQAMADNQQAGRVNSGASAQTTQRTISDSDRERLENYRKKKAQKNSNGANPNIVERAKSNNARFEQDETLEQIESMHGHKEKHEVKKEAHSDNCQIHKKEADVPMPLDSMFGSVEDLLAKGYSGDMNFERDFVGEAMDMLSNISVPDYSIKEMNIDNKYSI